VLSNIPETDIDEFLAWDTRLTHFIYGQRANPIVPLGYDRFPIHAILYKITGVEIEDRFIAYRIAHELFSAEYKQHFRHQLRGLIATARLVSGIKYWTRNQTEFELEFQQQMKRFRWYILKYIRRSETMAFQFGRGVSVSASDGGTEVFSDTPAANVNLAADSGIGMPDNVMVYISRIVNLHADISDIYARVMQYLRGLKSVNDLFCLATILADTDLYYKERKDRQQSAFADDLNSLVRESIARFEKALQLKPRHFSLAPVHAALLSMMPGVICNGKDDELSQSVALSLIDKIAEYLSNVGFQGNQLRLLAFLLVEHCHPYIRTQNFIYELWESEEVI
jgi:predicted nucleic acid-binding protein